MKPLDATTLDRLTELEAGATPGPWAEGCLMSARVRQAIDLDRQRGEAVLASVDTGTDIALVTASRDAIAALVAEVTYWRGRHGEPPTDLEVRSGPSA